MRDKVAEAFIQSLLEISQGNVTLLPDEWRQAEALERQPGLKKSLDRRWLWVVSLVIKA